MTNNFNFEIYEGKSFQDLCREVVDRCQSKKDQVDTLISDIRSQIKKPIDVQVYMPRIKELLEVGIKNDEQIIKLASVIQRIQSAQIEASGGDSGGLTEEEKEQLLQARINELEALKNVDIPIPTIDTFIK